MHETMISPVNPRAEWFVLLVRIAAICGMALAVVACSHGSAAPSDSTWDPKGAAAYLDRRMEWWSTWKSSARDHGTFCFSCHTAVPYALARPALRVTLAEPAAAAPERHLMDDVRRRVRLWGETSPFYTDQYVGPGKSAESRGTEAVLSALMLAWDDAHTKRLSADTVTAFDHMWAEQHASGDSVGAWSWLDFDLSPWEVPDAQYYGAALAALAVGIAPENYQTRPQIQQRLQLLRNYLIREYPAQSLHHRLILLWAATKLPGLLDAEQRQSLIAKVLGAENPDGGWSLSALVRKSGKGNTLLTDPDSDGYATGLVTLVLERAAMPVAAPEVRRSLTWLARNQRGHGGSWIRGQEGFWLARSLNKWRNPWSNVGRFMSDAATAYAVLALTEASQAEPGASLRAQGSAASTPQPRPSRRL
jgi:squalene-hopene/tetraprenyl-beta-curcumene cyclase